jgi:[acyl-carrier-protein] S-malonyltransferase
MLAFIFPGQGSQAVGMGKAFYEASPAARKIFDEANAALGLDLTRVMFEGPESELALTTNTQPAVLTVSVAAAAACAERGLQPSVAAGHSLGEYSALVVAGALRLRDAVRIVRKRGEFMQQAVPVGTGAMAAVMGLAVDAVEALCREAAREVVPFLLSQVASPVRWTECVQRLAAEGATAFVEVGPGRVLTALTKRIADGARAVAVEDPASLEKALTAVKA